MKDQVKTILRVAFAIIVIVGLVVSMIFIGPTSPPSPGPEPVTAFEPPTESPTQKAPTAPPSQKGPTSPPPQQ